MKKQKTWIANLICVAAVLGIFAVASLVLANVGIRVYKNIAMNNLENFEIRTSLLYISNKVRQSDSKECIVIKEKDNIKMLSLIDKADGMEYETLIYHYNGGLYELYHENGEDYELTDGMEVMNIKEFSIEEIGKSLIKITSGNTSGEKQSVILMSRTRR